mgnify:CR=1 FL=1
MMCRPLHHSSPLLKGETLACTGLPPSPTTDAAVMAAGPVPQRGRVSSGCSHTVESECQGGYPGDGEGSAACLETICKDGHMEQGSRRNQSRDDAIKFGGRGRQRLVWCPMHPVKWSCNRWAPSLVSSVTGPLLGAAGGDVALFSQGFRILSFCRRGDTGPVDWMVEARVSASGCG